MKKDPIDKLFKDKLGDYSEVPDEKVWQSISASLDKKKKSRKIIPIWWKLGGAAAVLALLLYLAGPLDFSGGTQQQVTDTENPSISNSPETGSPDLQLENPEDTDAVVAVPETEASADSSQGTNPAQNPREDSSDREEVAGTEDRRKDNAPDNRSDDPSGIAVTENRKADTRPEEEGSEANPQSPEETQVAERDPALPQRGEENFNKQATRAADPNEAVLAENVKEEPENPEGKSIFEEIAASEEEEEKELAENNSSRWSAGPRVAPVYFNSFGQGSPIHSNFVGNSKSGNVNFSYGLSVSYALSPKLSIRSGVHKVDYGYDTNDIAFSPTLAASAAERIDNINYSLSSRNVVVRTASQEKIAQDAFSAEVSAEFPSRSGRMVQQFGYVEVPLELNFALIDKKFGVNLVGGLSSLFLVDNSVSLESGGNATEMGEANNLNSLNFSTNIGFGLMYQLSPSMMINLEPVFKYQLNTFSDTAGDFNPYSVGVYSGLNFRF